MNESPVSYPSVTIADKSYQLKWSNAAIYRLECIGANLTTIGRELQEKRVSFKNVIDLLCACVVKTPRFEPEQLCELFPNPADVFALCPALWEAMGKAQPPAEKKLQEPAAEVQLQ